VEGTPRLDMVVVGVVGYNPEPESKMSRARIREIDQKIKVARSEDRTHDLRIR
jgi:hypothetical protein